MKCVSFIASHRPLSEASVIAFVPAAARTAHKLKIELPRRLAAAGRIVRRFNAIFSNSPRPVTV